MTVSTHNTIPVTDSEFVCIECSLVCGYDITGKNPTDAMEQSMFPYGGYLCELLDFCVSLYHLF